MQELKPNADKLIRYIRTASKCQTQINEYVPNSHIADTFEEVLECLEYMRDYPEVFQCNPEDSPSLRDAITHFQDHVDVKFIYSKPTIEQIHEAYQSLRYKHDFIRNFLKLYMIHYHDEFMHLRCKRVSSVIIRKINSNQYKF